MEKVLGKISSVSFGFNSDYPHLFGLQLYFKMEGCGIGDGGCHLVNISEECKYTDSCERKAAYAKAFEQTAEILKAAKISDVSQLKDIPVEITIDKNTFKSFRILTEVL